MRQMLDNSLDYLKNLFNNPIVKVVGAEATILARSFSDAKMAVLTILSLVIIDTVLGMIVAAKFGNLSSWGFRKSMYKLLFYLIVVLLGSISYVAWGIPWIKEAFVGLIISTELISILENTEICAPGIVPKIIINRLKLSVHRKKSKHSK